MGMAVSWLLQLAELYGGSAPVDEDLAWLLEPHGEQPGQAGDQISGARDAD